MWEASGLRVGVAVVAGSGAGVVAGDQDGTCPYPMRDETGLTRDWTGLKRDGPGLSRLDFLTKDWTGLLRDWTEEEMAWSNE
jgi:hypothetical protein